MEVQHPEIESGFNQIIDDRPYPVPEAGQCLGFKTTKMYALLNEGKLKAIKLGTQTRIMGSELRRFLNSAPIYKGGAR